MSVSEKPRRGPVVARFDAVCFSYGNVPVLSNAHFHIHAGEFVALVGANGAGKTTVLKLLLSLEKPVSGSVRLFEGFPDAGRDRIGYVPQHAGYDPSFPITVREVVRMGRLKALSRRYGDEDEQAVREALEKAEIVDLADRPYAALSGGQRRRVLVARALAARPLLLVLDEPAANMDAESEERLFRTLGALKGSTTILIVTHDTLFVSSLTDVVLCVGESPQARGQGRTITRHRTEPAIAAPHELYGGNAVQVRHDVRMGDTEDCEEGEANR